MHAEAWQYISKVRGFIPSVTNLHILEIGAHNVNGSPRDLFAGCAEYVGLDPWPGQGVDIVSSAQDYDGMGTFDIVISAETLEHDSDPRGQIESAGRALKTGGKLIITAAAEPRKPHRCDGFDGGLNGEYYQNIKPADLLGWLQDWVIFEIEHNRQHGDVYALAVKK